MKITIIIGSHRINSESKRIGELIANQFVKNYFNEICVHNLSEMGLPFWDEGIWKGEERWNKILSPIKETQRTSDAFLIISPEWGGMVPPMLKNYLMIAGEEELGHKPALAIGVSASINGAYPISELRSFGTKNNKLVLIPEHLIIRNCESALTPEDLHDLTDRIEYSVKVLASYSVEMRKLRSNLNIPSDYPYGM